jgi:hypothetical protein
MELQARRVHDTHCALGIDTNLILATITILTRKLVHRGIGLAFIIHILSPYNILSQQI